MNYYDEIKEKIIKSETYDKVKDYSEDRTKVVNAYFEICKLLNEAGGKCGDKIIDECSKN